MKKLRPNIKTKWVSKNGIGIEEIRAKRASVPIEYFKGKRKSSFWTGLIWGFVGGYSFYVAHMQQWW
jgi:hypothetical protein